ncbi:hypothetical protein TRFO_32625 [Tritrichomonas foetus]|uniref:non-specific serine/threonine protein kinase n=1 Tax=Tritrichomonas foetus TaxID=1144522 RepID=A0A1J4JNE9_9EUKA|nr:hypothetical protein TRFO_32625 [Tritrichomonas foetus]|eukprot:OHT00655.1 hypothetical protein TRFO_32625 [Tritrichomonas foetus]
MNPLPLSNTDQVIGSHYKLKRKIGSGSFGEIYEAETIRTHRPVAVKLESLSAPIPQLSYEAKLYTVLSGGPGIPQVRWFGAADNHNALVIDLLGKSIENHLEMCRNRLSLKTVLMLADQMLCCIEFIHNKNFIHRDIKPDNFVMGTGHNSNSLFIIDFGLAKKYRDPNTHVHVPYSEGKSLTGTARYASIGALRGLEQSRRDDLESLAYVLIYLLKGSLPWMGLDAVSRHERYDKILDMKVRIPIDELCAGIPKEFASFLLAVKKLRFADKPKYARYRAIFRNLFISSGFVYDYNYDWTPYVTPFDIAPVDAAPSTARFPHVRISKNFPVAKHSNKLTESPSSKSANALTAFKINVTETPQRELQIDNSGNTAEILSTETTGKGSRTTLPSIVVKNTSYDGSNDDDDDDDDKTLSSSMSDSEPLRRDYSASSSDY